MFLPVKIYLNNKEIQHEYQRHCAKLFERVLSINRLAITYSRPKNIVDYVTQAKLHQAPGRFASTIMGDLEQGLYPLSLPLFFHKFSLSDSLLWCTYAMRENLLKKQSNFVNFTV